MIVKHNNNNNMIKLMLENCTFILYIDNKIDNNLLF